MIGREKLSKSIAKVGFHIICTYLACHLTITQTSRFLANEDISMIVYKPFNDSPDDLYPTFTICFHGAELRWYNEAPIYDSFEVTSFQYGELLKGEEVRKYEYNYNTRLYDKISVNIRNGSNKDFERFSLHISDVFTGLEYGTDDDENSIYYEKGMEIKDIPLEVSYNTPDVICFTRKTTDGLKNIRKYDWLLFNQSIFGNELYKNVHFKVFIHYPGINCSGMNCLGMNYPCMNFIRISISIYFCIIQDNC